MTFEDSYLGRLRRDVGSRIVLMPGAGVLARDEHGRVLFTRRADDGSWCMPGGGAEEGSSFASTAAAELYEEAGLVVPVEELVAFASVSEASVHIVRYPNGDLTHCFALWFLAERWTGELRADGEETTEVGFFDRGDLPAPLAGPSRLALELYDAFVETGRFQAR
jgi:ADP-ribose pyrophosphatase YjhB (NUDIX family)